MPAWVRRLAVDAATLGLCGAFLAWRLGAAPAPLLRLGDGPGGPGGPREAPARSRLPPGPPQAAAGGAPGSAAAGTPLSGAGRAGDAGAGVSGEEPGSAASSAAAGKPGGAAGSAAGSAVDSASSGASGDKAHSAAGGGADVKPSGASVGAPSGGAPGGVVPGGVVPGGAPSSAAGSSGNALAVLVVGFKLGNGDARGALWSFFDGLLSGLSATAWQMEVFFCCHEGNTLAAIASAVGNATVQRYAHVPLHFPREVVSANVYQFGRALGCFSYAKRHAQQSGKGFDFYLRTRPDMTYGVVHLPLDLSTSCVYSRLRWFSGLAGITCQTASAQGHRSKRKHCGDMDDQFALVPAPVAETFFAFGKVAESKGGRPRYAHGGSCQAGRAIAEASLSGYVLTHGLRICPIGLAATRACVTLALNRHRRTEWDGSRRYKPEVLSTCNPCKSWPKGKGNLSQAHRSKDERKAGGLPYDEWIEGVMRGGG